MNKRKPITTRAEAVKALKLAATYLDDGAPITAAEIIEGVNEYLKGAKLWEAAGIKG